MRAGVCILLMLVTFLFRSQLTSDTVLLECFFAHLCISAICLFVIWVLTMVLLVLKV